MDERTVRELQARIETLEARLARVEGHQAEPREGPAGSTAKRRLWLGVAAAGVAIATVSYAATISVPNTFVNGQIADADEVNVNFNTLIAESNDQDVRIAALETMTSNLLTMINDLYDVDAITFNYVMANSDQIALNTPAIAVNAADIASNTAAIGTNASDIASNTAAIGTNTSDIASNTAAIGTNASDIATNAAGIGGLNTTFAGVSRAGTLLTFSGMNVRVVNGSGSTVGTLNGLGNLIVGYNENNYSATRTGAHNLIVGMDHEYTSAAGFVTGQKNTISGGSASVTGGYDNTASYGAAHVSGGQGNVASFFGSSVSGGYQNTASFWYSSVSGGRGNTASGNGATVAGGNGNSTSIADDVAPLLANHLPCASQVGSEVIFHGCNVNVRDGSGDTLGTPNGLGNLVVGYNENSFARTRTGSHNLIVGQDHEYTSSAGAVFGLRNSISGLYATVTAGFLNYAIGVGSSVSGGTANMATTNQASVSGGENNAAAGYASSVCGGEFNNLTAAYTSALGPVPEITISGP